MTSNRAAAVLGVIVLGALTLGAQSGPSIGREVFAPVHLRDGQEYSTPLPQLLAHGQRLFAIGESQAPPARTYSHGYYLFIAPPADACAACYVPLLLTSKRMEELAHQTQGETCVLITTYERDSIVRMDRGLSVSPMDVKTQERHIRVRGVLYRYQEVTAAEVLRLLERPEGTIPIHRVIGTPSRRELEDLITLFQAVK